jgi:putative heme iron utilization protein
MPAERPLRPDATLDDAALAKTLMAEAITATLAVIGVDDLPYTALTAHGLTAAGQPLVLASDLSAHGKALKADGRLSLLFTGGIDPGHPLTAPRLTISGRAVLAESMDRESYLACQPSAAHYFDFGDMCLYRIEMASAHLVAGFGRAVSIPPSMLKIRSATIP